MNPPSLQPSMLKGYDKDSKSNITDKNVDCARISQNHIISSVSPRQQGQGEPELALIRASTSFLQEFDDMIEGIDIPKLLKEHHTMLRFPEKAEREALTNGRSVDSASLAWTSNGKALVVRNTNELLYKLLPLAACQVKYMSFKRKLYRWGFRQVKGKTSANNKKSGECVFHHPLFRRDNKPLMVGMRSITAEGTRRAFSAQQLVVQQEVSFLQPLMNYAPSDTLGFLAQNLPPAPLGSTRSSFFSPASMVEQQAMTHPTLFVNPPQPCAGLDIGGGQLLSFTTSSPHNTNPSAMNQVIAEIQTRTARIQAGCASPSQTSTTAHNNNDATILLRTNFPDASSHTRMVTAGGAFEGNLPNDRSMFLSIWQPWSNRSDGNQDITRGK